MTCVISEKVIKLYQELKKEGTQKQKDRFVLFSTEKDMKDY